MPFTFFAHQSVILPLKTRRPGWFDGTALVIGSMAPDFAYPIRGWVQHHSHTPVGIFAWGLPFTLVVVTAMRAWVAACAFAHLPDFGPLRVHSYRALRERWTPWWMVLYSSLIGVSSHVVLDSFTHKNTTVARRLHLTRIAFHAPWGGNVSIARALQYVGHTVGTAICIVMLATIGRRRLMERWYGEDVIVAVRRFRLRRRQRYAFWAVSLAGVPVGAWWHTFSHGSVVTKLFLTLAVSTGLACAMSYCQPRERPLTYYDKVPDSATPPRQTVSPSRRPTRP